MSRILVKAPNWVGDCVLATPAIAWLRGVFQEAGIIVLVRPVMAEIFRNNPHVSGIVEADDRSLDRETRKGLKTCNFDAVALMPNSLRSAWLAWRLGIPRRVGFAREKRRFLLTHPIAYDPRDWRTPSPKPQSASSIRPRPGRTKPPRHMVQYYLAIAQRTAAALGSDAHPGAASCGVPPLVLPVDLEARRRVDLLLAESGLAGKPLVGVGPGATGGAAKCWPAAMMAEAADRLADIHGAQLVSTAITAESAAAEELAARCRHPVHRLGEGLDLPGIIALIDRLSLFLVNDSGAMHLAAARSVPTVAVFGSTDWGVTFPWSASARVVRAVPPPPCAPCLLRECPLDHACMTAVGPDAVVEAAAGLVPPGEMAARL